MIVTGTSYTKRCEAQHIIVYAAVKGSRVGPVLVHLQLGCDHDSGHLSIITFRAKIRLRPTQNE